MLDLSLQPHENNHIEICLTARCCTGDITIVLETKLDLRDGAAWSQLDKAIGKLEGGEDEEESDSEEDIPDSGISFLAPCPLIPSL